MTCSQVFKDVDLVVGRCSCNDGCSSGFDKLNRTSSPPALTYEKVQSSLVKRKGSRHQYLESKLSVQSAKASIHTVHSNWSPGTRKRACFLIIEIPRRAHKPLLVQDTILLQCAIKASSETGVCCDSTGRTVQVGLAEESDNFVSRFPPRDFASSVHNLTCAIGARHNWEGKREWVFSLPSKSTDCKCSH